MGGTRGATRMRWSRKLQSYIWILWTKKGEGEWDGEGETESEGMKLKCSWKNVQPLVLLRLQQPEGRRSDRNKPSPSHFWGKRDEESESAQKGDRDAAYEDRHLGSSCCTVQRRVNHPEEGALHLRTFQQLCPAFRSSGSNGFFFFSFFKSPAPHFFDSSNCSFQSSNCTLLLRVMFEWLVFTN